MALDLDTIEARFAILFASENEESFNKWYREKIKSERDKGFIGYKCISDCILDGRRYEFDEKFLLEDAECDRDWPGTTFFDRHPDEFEAIYENENEDNQGGTYAAYPPIDQIAAPDLPDNFSWPQLKEAAKMIFQQSENKLLTVKWVKDQTGWGLWESKKFCDDL